MTLAGQGGYPLTLAKTRSPELKVFPAFLAIVDLDQRPIFKEVCGIFQSGNVNFFACHPDGNYLIHSGKNLATFLPPARKLYLSATTTCYKSYIPFTRRQIIHSSDNFFLKLHFR